MIPAFSRLLFLILCLCVGLPSATAQPSAIASQLTPELETLAGRMDALEVEVKASAEDDARLVEIRGELGQLEVRLADAQQKANARLAEVNARLEQIGPPPEGGAAEAPAIVQERAARQGEKSEINALIGQIEALSDRIDTMNAYIAAQRRQLFSDTLSRRYDILAAIGPNVLEESRGEGIEFYQRVSGWISFIVKDRLETVILATLGSLVAAFVLLVAARRVIANMVRPDPAIEDPTYLARLSVAFWSTILKSGTLAVFLVLTYYSFSYFSLLRDDIEPILITVFNVIATVYFINCLAHAALAPDLPNWRLVSMESGPARMLYWLIWATSVVTGLDFILNRISEVQSSPLSLTIAKSLIATVLVGMLLILISMVKPFLHEDGSPRRWGPLLRFLLRLIGAATIVAALLGFIGLARFISQQAVITSALLATMYIGFLTAREVSDFGAFSKTELGRRLDARFNFNEQVEDQLGLAASIILNCLILVIGVPLILLQWGFQWGDIYAIAYRLGNEVSIGTMRVSLFGILTGIVIFIAGYFVTRWFQGWVDSSVLSRGKVDAGVRNSIRTIAGYIGIAIALLLGISAAGISLSSFALIAGALSLGIGFGLQNIVSNFVSGLILLAERPFKVGDWIVAGPVTGNVKRINVRATEIETFQKQTIVLPNSELINAAVGNWTHRNKLGRVDMSVGVSYDVDPRRTHAILIEILKSHPTILKSPEPLVSFSNFGASSLDFDLMFHLADITGQLAVKNEIRFTIFERFKEEGISIPYPQQDVHIRSMPPSAGIDASGGEKVAGVPAKEAKAGRTSRKVAQSARQRKSVRGGPSKT